MISKSEKGELNIIGRGEDEKKRCKNSGPGIKESVEEKIPENEGTKGKY